MQGACVQQEDGFTHLITGMTLLSSCCGVSSVAPGRVLCPPTSSMSAPSTAICLAVRTMASMSTEPWYDPMADSTVLLAVLLGASVAVLLAVVTVLACREAMNWPPSLKLSGVTFSIPMTNVRSPQVISPPPRPAGVTRRMTSPTVTAPVPAPAGSLCAVLCCCEVCWLQCCDDWASAQAYASCMCGRRLGSSCVWGAACVEGSVWAEVLAVGVVGLSYDRYHRSLRGRRTNSRSRHLCGTQDDTHTCLLCSFMLS